ncbi:MAG TPA: glycosyltransferase, partial [Noviherbaspirillum sp.]
GQAPTKWQKSLYPKEYQSKIHIVHEGIDTANVKPDADACFALPNSDVVFTPADEVVTYVARNLEPYRGFPSFMRSLPAILSARPKAQVLVVGGDDVSYGTRLPDGKTYRQQLLDEVGKDIDLARVHFLGKVPYSSFVRILQVSSVHVYLTYPFVLSWSMLEAMSAGCVIVGSRTQPVEEVIKDGENGVLVDIFKPAEISAKVIDVLARRQDYLGLRANARKSIVEQYDLRSICLPAQLRLMNMAARGML